MAEETADRGPLTMRVESIALVALGCHEATRRKPRRRRTDAPVHSARTINVVSSAAENARSTETRPSWRLTAWKWSGHDESQKGAAVNQVRRRLHTITRRVATRSSSRRTVMAYSSRK